MSVQYNFKSALDWKRIKIEQKFGYVRFKFGEAILELVVLVV